LNVRIFGDVAAYLCCACGWFCFVWQTLQTLHSRVILSIL